MTQKHDNLNGGKSLAGTGFSPNLNSSNLADVIGDYTQASAEQLDAAVQAARAAFPAWSTSGIQARADALDKIGTEILARRAELGMLLAREEGKTRAEGIGEAARAGNIFKFFAGECPRLTGEVVPSVRTGIGVEISREPVGVIYIITPWNFPIAIPAWKIVPALAYGDCVAIKPAGLVPGCAWALAEIISRSGIPAGVFSLVMRRGSMIGDLLVNHQGVDAISFTGSQAVGGRIAQQCAVILKKIQLEMDGKNPQVILDDADLAQAVERSVQSAFFSTGQRCTASRSLIATEGVYWKFVEAKKARMAGLKVGDALAVGTNIGPVSSLSQLDQDMNYVDIGKAEGAVLLAGGERSKLSTDGFFMAPALLTDTTGDMRINREEVFGPVASIIRVKGHEEALLEANNTPFGLAAGIATTSLKQVTHFKRHSQAAMVMVNLPTAGLDYHVPFGGRKGSSYGPREQGRYAQDFFTIVKTAYTLA